MPAGNQWSVQFDLGTKQHLPRCCDELNCRSWKLRECSSNSVDKSCFFGGLSLQMIAFREETNFHLVWCPTLLVDRPAQQCSRWEPGGSAEFRTWQTGWGEPPRNGAVDSVISRHRTIIKPRSCQHTLQISQNWRIWTLDANESSNLKALTNWPEALLAALSAAWAAVKQGESQLSTPELPNPMLLPVCEGFRRQNVAKLKLIWSIRIYKAIKWSLWYELLSTMARLGV